MTKCTLQVGQVLYFVPSYSYGNSYEITVEKIGRKWATTSHRHRIDLVTLRADGGGWDSPGRAYLSRAEHETEQARHAAWSGFTCASCRTWPAKTCWCATTA